MSSSRKLSDRIAWTDEDRAIELLDWETRPEHFDQLCARILEAFRERDGLTPEALFERIPEVEFRKQVRFSAERFTERHYSILIFVYMRLKYWAIPELRRQRGST
jgi:hypothetical protein